MNLLPAAIAVTDLIIRNMGGRNTREVVTKCVPDPVIMQQLKLFQEQNANLLQKFDELQKKMADLKVDSFEDLKRYDEEGAKHLVRLATQTPPFQMQGRNIGFFGLTSTGKSTVINKFLHRDVAKTGPGETTTEIEPYDGQGYRLYDIPGRNDERAYFSMEYVAFWKGLTARVVLITASIKEMTKVFHLLDAINLKYDILFNKFDLVNPEDREALKAQIRQEIIQCGLKGANHVWFVSSQNPGQFPDWMTMVDYLTPH